MEANTKRYAALIEYDGSPYSGWQRQLHARSVQAEVEQAISRVADHAVTVVCAGRTDSGVHALGQVIHFDSSAQRSLREWRLGINSNLPVSIVLCDLREVDPTFHARFSARARGYRYLVLNSFNRPALQHHRVTWIHQPLDHRLMDQAACILLGKHDFTSFRALGCQAKNPVREIYQISVRRKHSMVYMQIRANGFLHHMVRNIMGSLLTIGRGQNPPQWMQEVLNAKNRTIAGMTAPAHGLYLTEVSYDADRDPGFQPCDFWSEFVYTY